MMYGWDGPGFGMFLGPLFLLAFITLAAWIVAMVFRANGNTARGATPPSNALNILDERFARGEIDKAEYEDRRKTILSRP